MQLSNLLWYHADRQTNMQMNQPIWFVEDRKLMTNDEGKKKLQEVADANSKSQSRLTIVHGAEFDKARQLSLDLMLALCGEVWFWSPVGQNTRNTQKEQTKGTDKGGGKLSSSSTAVWLHFCIVSLHV